jgi:hypothetical protein
MFMPFGFLAAKDFKIICRSNILVLGVPDEGYYRDASSTLDYIQKCITISVSGPLLVDDNKSRGASSAQ